MLRSRMLLLLAGWLMLTTAAYALILTGEQRGAGMDGTLLILLATLIGGVSLLAAFVTLFGSGFHRSPTRFRSFLMCMAVAASCAGVLPVLYYGRVLYLKDQEEAKRFVEQRIADASVRVAEGQPWPATQEHFIAGQPLPRLLRGKRFYTHEADDHFVIDIPVDFGIAWVYDSRRATWPRNSCTRSASRVRSNSS